MHQLRECEILLTVTGPDVLQYIAFDPLNYSFPPLNPYS
jgi:hypothetical protein